MDNNNIHHLPTYKKPKAGLGEDSKKAVRHKIPVENLRNVSISLKVSEGQNRQIKSLAKQCNMSRSSYMLARAYNYQPRTRLTKEEMELLSPLVEVRSDIIKFTSALKSLSAEERKARFRQFGFMLDWMKELAKTQGQIESFLNRVSAPNQVPPPDDIK